MPLSSNHARHVSRLNSLAFNSAATKTVLQCQTSTTSPFQHHQQPLRPSVSKMSKTVHIASLTHFNEVLRSSRIVVTDFYADWCGPCKAVEPVYEQLSARISRPKQVTFTKVDTDAQSAIASKYQITTLPTFVIFKEGKVVEKVGPEPKKLQDVINKLVAEVGGASGSAGFGGSESSSRWRATDMPKGYDDVNDQLDIKGLDLLNGVSNLGGVRDLFESGKPSALQNGKAAEGQAKDWVESDTDEQLMLFLPFQSTLKLHSIQITSLPPADDDAPMRPKTIRLYSNRHNILGFEEADDIEPTQTLTISKEDWDATGTATVLTRFVKFQSVSSLVMYFTDGDGDEEKVRVDRIRLVGEVVAKREMGKLEKIGDEQGE